MPINKVLTIKEAAKLSGIEENIFREFPDIKKMMTGRFFQTNRAHQKLYWLDQFPEYIQRLIEQNTEEK